MSKALRSHRSIVIPLILVWMALNVILMLLILPGDYEDINNWIELGLWSCSIAGLASMRKWGAALTVFTLIYTFSLSTSIIIYYQIWLNAFRLVVNAALIVYMFKSIFEGKFK